MSLICYTYFISDLDVSNWKKITILFIFIHDIILNWRLLFFLLIQFFLSFSGFSVVFWFGLCKYLFSVLQQCDRLSTLYCRYTWFEIIAPYLICLRTVFISTKVCNCCIIKSCNIFSIGLTYIGCSMGSENSYNSKLY